MVGKAATSSARRDANDANANADNGRKIWCALVGANAVLSLAIGLHLGEAAPLAWLTAVAALFTTALAAAPYARFFDRGWCTRHDEFRNLLWGDALSEYLWHFWHRRADEAGALHHFECGTNASETDLQKQARWAKAATLFNTIYREQYGLGAFAVPLGFLLLVIFVETHFMVLVSLSASLPENGYVFPYIHTISNANVNLALSAICGAYFFVVGDSVDSIRKECLNASDVYWYVLRMLLAVPIAAALTFALPGAAADAVAFALGAFPVNFILKQLRQLASGQLKAQPDEVADQLIKLDGVTSPTVALLTAEGITSIDQLLGIDPVLLSIRTGLPFRSILRLCSQAIVRRHFGDAAFELSALGLADAPAILCLVRELRSDQSHEGSNWKVLADASALLKNHSTHEWPQEDAVRFAFENIASFAYTHFLMSAGFERAPRQFVHEKPAKPAGEKKHAGEGGAMVARVVAAPRPEGDAAAAVVQPGAEQIQEQRQAANQGGTT
jgi:hypothetical protein